MKGITYCGECIYYSTKKHKCMRGASVETDPRAHFYDDCPLPEVEPVKHGKWIRKKTTPDTERYICSGCFVTGKYRVWLGVDGLNYCPYCGARMEVTDDDVDNP